MAKEIKIVIERKSGVRLVQYQETFAGLVSAKGIIERARETDYLPRRLQKKTGIQFYDLGLFFNDETGFAELVFERTCTYTLSEFGLGINRSQVSDADHQDLVDYVMSVGVENLETSYYRMGVDYADFYRVLVIGDTFFLDTEPFADYWSEEGFKLTDEQLATGNLTFVPAWTTALPITVKGSGKNKITATYDYAAPVAEFVPGKSDKYFFLPRIATPRAFTARNSPTSNDFLVSNHRLMPRLPFVFPDEPTYHLPPLQQWTSGEDAGELENAQKLAGLVNDADYNIRVVRRTQVAPGVVDTSEIPPSSFPRADIFTAPQGVLEVDFTAIDDPPTGTLIAVIKQGSSFFYVWK